MAPSKLAFVITVSLVGAAIAAGGPAVAGVPAAVLVSVSSAGVQANRSSAEQVVSTNGRFVAFSSLATNLVRGDTNRVADIFVRDVAAGRTTRVSLSTGGRQANARANQPAISAGGRYVSFGSKATNLVPADTNGQQDVVLHA